MNIVRKLALLLVVVNVAYCNESKLSRKELYKHGFRLKRGEQVEGVKRILKIEDYSKKTAMVKLLLQKIFDVLMKAKIIVESSGYVPGDEFPENQQHLDALGNVFENVAFFGDLLLRLPDITHKLYDKNNEWAITMKWGIVFSNETGVFEDSSQEMLHLVSQELELVPRDPNYVNPYKEATKRAEQKKKREKEEELRKEKEMKKSEKKRRRRKGPRLGGGGGEL